MITSQQTRKTVLKRVMDIRERDISGHFQLGTGNFTRQRERFSVYDIFIQFGMVFLFDAGIQLGPVEERFQGMKLAGIDKLPAYHLLVVIEESLFFFFSQGICFFQRFQGVVGADESKLFIELRSVLAVPAMDAVHQFT
jgi:hypothetical protein